MTQHVTHPASQSTTGHVMYHSTNACKFYYNRPLKKLLLIVAKYLLDCSWAPRYFFRLVCIDFILLPSGHGVSRLVVLENPSGGRYTTCYIRYYDCLTERRCPEPQRCLPNCTGMIMWGRALALSFECSGVIWQSGATSGPSTRYDGVLLVFDKHLQLGILHSQSVAVGPLASLRFCRWYGDPSTHLYRVSPFSSSCDVPVPPTSTLLVIITRLY